MRQLAPGTRRIMITADSVGGVWRYAVDVGRALSGRGATVCLAGLGPEPSPAQQAELAGSGVELMWLDAALDWTVSGPEGVRMAAARLDRLVAAWAPQILHLNAPTLAGHLAAAPCIVAAAHSCIATWWRAVHGTSPPGEWRWHQQEMARGFAAAAVVIVPSAAYGAALQRVYGPLPGLAVVHNGSAAVAPGEKEVAVLSAGRWWDESKNLRVLDAAAAHLPWPVRLAGPLVGPNGARAAPVHAIHLGDLSHAEMRRALGQAAIFVSPSIYEPFGLAVLEAASAGAALVLSDIPTFRELWEGCALFADPRDPAAFAAAIAELAENVPERDRLAAAARGRAARYTLDAQLDGLLSVYSRAVEGAAQVA